MNSNELSSPQVITSILKGGIWRPLRIHHGYLQTGESGPGGDDHSRQERTETGYPGQRGGQDSTGRPCTGAGHPAEKSLSENILETGQPLILSVNGYFSI